MPPTKPPKPPAKRPSKAAKGGAVGGAEAPENVAKYARNNTFPEWAQAAYTAHVGRGQTISALAREFGVDWETVKRNVEKMHVAVCAAENSDTVDARAKHEARLREVLKCLWQDYARADNQNARAAGLKSIADVSEKLAACQGVVTQRAAMEHGGTLKVDHGSEAIESLTRAIAGLAARAAEECGDPQPDAPPGGGPAD